MSEQFFEDYAQAHAPTGGVLYDVLGEPDMACGLLMVGDAALDTYDRQQAPAAPQETYARIFMPCGHTMAVDKREHFPKQDYPCACGQADHWFIFWYGAQWGKPDDPVGPLEGVTLS